jgi:hypothetical protein
VLWAVYELVERWGVTYLLHGDVLPEDAGPLRLPEGEVRMRPRLARRAWRTISTLAFGPESWSLAEYRRAVDQWAKWSGGSCSATRPSSRTPTCRG